MKLFSVATLIISCCLATVQAQDGVMQIIAEGEDCQPKADEKSGKSGGLFGGKGPLRKSSRCAKTIFPAGYERMEYITYTFWKCGTPIDDGDTSASACYCIITRSVGVPADVVVWAGTDEYISERSCNAKCGRGTTDKCWVCKSGGWAEPSCKHKSEYPSHEGMTMTRSECLKKCLPGEDGDDQKFELP